jgi:flavin-dependent dehydrogenase
VESEIPLSQIPDFKLSEEIVFDLGYPRMGYGWVFQKGDYISIGIYGPANSKPNPVDWFWRYLEKYGIRLKKEMVHYRSYPCTVFENPGDPVGRNRILLAGDAANFIDPLLGEGIYYALRSGRIVGEQVLTPGTIQLSPQEVQSQYQSLLQSTLFPELVASRGLADLIYRFPQLSFKLFKREPELFDSFCQVLSAEQGFAQFSKHAKDVLLRRHPLMTQLLLTLRRIL